MRWPPQQHKKSKKPLKILKSVKADPIFKKDNDLEKENHSRFKVVP